MPLDITNWKTPAHVLAAQVDDNLSELAIGSSLFVGFLPEDFDSAMAFIDQAGGEQNPVSKIDEVKIQVYSKNTDYEVGYNLQRLVQSELQSIPATNTLDTDLKIIGIWATSNIAFLGRDKKNNSLFSSNFRVMLETNKDINRQ